MEYNGNALEQYNPLDALKPQQVLALEKLLTGARLVEAAQAANVGRKTVSRWMHDNFEFRAALNAGRKELRASHERRLENLVSKALTTVEQAVEQGDAKAAFRVLEGLGFLNGERPKVGSTRPATVEREHVKHVAYELKQDAWARDDYELVYRAASSASDEAEEGASEEDDGDEGDDEDEEDSPGLDEAAERWIQEKRETMSNPEAPARARIQAAKAMLNAAWGPPR